MTGHPYRDPDKLRKLPEGGAVTYKPNSEKDDREDIVVILACSLICAAILFVGGMTIGEGIGREDMRMSIKQNPILYCEDAAQKLVAEYPYTYCRVGVR